MIDKIIESIFMQFIFNLLRMTLTQKVIACRVLKIHKWVQRNVYEWRKVFIRNDK